MASNRRGVTPWTTAAVVVPLFACGSAAVDPDAGPGADAAPSIDPAQAEADWIARATGSAVVYSQDFRSFATTAEMRAAADIGYAESCDASSGTCAYETALATSGCVTAGRCLEIRTYDTAGAQGGGWGQFYDSGDPIDDFYVQFAVYLAGDGVAFPGNGSKVVNLEQYGSGQIVVTHNRNAGFVTAFLNGAPGLRSYREFENGSHDWFYQNAVNHADITTLDTLSQRTQKYGPSRGMLMVDRDSAEYQALFADALSAGAVPWVVDGWTVVEVYVRGCVGPSQVKIWAAAYGSAPALIMDTADPDTETQLSCQPDNYRQFEALEYDTDRSAEPGRPTIVRKYDQFIASRAPIPFPGHLDAALPTSNTEGGP